MKRHFCSIALLAIVLVWVVPIRTSMSAQDSPHRIVVNAKRYSYEPNEVTLKKGEPVELVLMSKDVTHGLHSDELKIDLQVPKGGSVHTTFTPETVGDFVGQCSVFCGEGHGNMAITFHVVD